MLTPEHQHRHLSTLMLTLYTEIGSRICVFGIHQSWLLYTNIGFLQQSRLIIMCQGPLGQQWFWRASRICEVYVHSITHISWGGGGGGGV